MPQVGRGKVGEEGGKRSVEERQAPVSCLSVSWLVGLSVFVGHHFLQLVRQVSFLFSSDDISVCIWV